MQTMKQAAAGFLAGKRVAVTGVSRHPKDHGSNVVYQRLRQRGYTVFAVNPNADKVEGDTCYHDLKSIPGGVDWVVIGTRPGNSRRHHAGVRRPRHQPCLDAPRARCRERVAFSR